MIITHSVPMIDQQLGFENKDSNLAGLNQTTLQESSRQHPQEEMWALRWEKQKPDFISNMNRAKIVSDMVEEAATGLKKIKAGVQRIQELSLGASNDSFAHEARKSHQSEMAAIRKDIDVTWQKNLDVLGKIGGKRDAWENEPSFLLQSEKSLAKIIRKISQVLSNPINSSSLRINELDMRNHEQAQNVEMVTSVALYEVGLIENEIQETLVDMNNYQKLKSRLINQDTYRSQKNNTTTEDVSQILARVLSQAPNLEVPDFFPTRAYQLLIP